MSTFSENLRRIRFEKHMTQEEFADLLGTTKQNISRYESGAVSPKISTAAKIAKKLGVSLSELNGSTDYIDTMQRLGAIKESLEQSTQSKDFRMLSAGFKEFEKKKNAEFQFVVNMLCKSYPEFFVERNDDDDPES